MAYYDYPSTSTDTQIEGPEILVYQAESQPKDRQADRKDRQTEAEQDWADKLTRNRTRMRFLRALRHRRKRRIVNHRYRAPVLTRRLLDPSPRDKRELG